jgi:hypothetical protein
MTKTVVTWIVVIVTVLFGTVGFSAAATFSGSSGNLSASADFIVQGTNLVVTLSNTGSADALVPADVLTAVFFNIAGNPTLTPLSAVLNSGSTVYYDPQGQPAGGVVGGEWAYGGGLSGAPSGATWGISSSGFGLFGGANFGGPNLAGPGNGAVNGLQYGILSAGDNFATGNGGISGTDGLIWNSVVFTLSGISSGFDPSSGITNVSFQYGTALTEPNVSSVPEPSLTLLLGLGLVVLGTATFWKRSAVR